jgi:hypothetical protein
LQTKSTVQSTRICDDGIALDETPAALATAAPRFRGDDWSLRHRHLGRELRRPTAGATPTQAVPHGRRRFDPPQNLVEQLQQLTAPSIAGICVQPTTTSLRERSRRVEASQIVAWLVIMGGAICLAAGIGLIGWSLAENQLAYWNLALGLTLGGQGTLILGLVLAVSRLWRSSRHAATKLQDVHVRLAQLQQTADVLTAMRSGGAPAFYAELARGASPQVLLANLKGQLEQLATRVSSGW